MKVTVNEQQEIQIEEVYTAIKFVTKDGETLYVNMRDSGFELLYGNQYISAKKGVVYQKPPTGVMFHTIPIGTIFQYESSRIKYLARKIGYSSIEFPDKGQTTLPLDMVVLPRDPNLPFYQN